MFPWEQAVPESCSESASNVCPELSSNPPGLFPCVKNWAIQYLPPRFVARSVSMSVKHLEQCLAQRTLSYLEYILPVSQRLFLQGQVEKFWEDWSLSQENTLWHCNSGSVSLTFVQTRRTHTTQQHQGWTWGDNVTPSMSVQAHWLWQVYIWWSPDGEWAKAGHLWTQVDGKSVFSSQSCYEPKIALKN